MILSVNKQNTINKIQNDVRVDGRKLDEYRDIKIIPNYINASAEGSCMVKIGKTKVLVGVKVAIGSPFPDTPDDGVLMVGAELVPVASENFEPGPPGEDSIELARVTDRGIRESRMIDTKKLCIIPGEKVYMVFVDLHVLDYDGNLFDASSIGAITALKTAVLPRYDKKTNKLIKDDKCKPIPLTDEAIGITARKIGDKIIFDPTALEESVVDSRLTVSFKKNGSICAMQKGESGGLTIDQITQMVSQAKKISLQLRKKVDSLKI